MKNLIILILFGGILYLTNPGVEKFVTYYGEKMEVQRAEGGFTDIVSSTIKDLNVNLNSKRKNYYIFSIYETTIISEERYLGILGMFFELSKDDK